MVDYANHELIDRTIYQYDDREHDHLEVWQAEEVLDQIQQSAEKHWNEWVDTIERGDAMVVYEDNDVIVLDTGELDMVSEEMELVPHIEDGDIARSILSAVVERAATKLADWDWSHTYPFIIEKPECIEDGQQYTDSIINSLLRRGLSPGQAWAYYGVKIRGYSRNRWSKRCGYSDHSATSEPLRKAEEKLEL